jgi:chromosome partitioning protein
MISLAICNKKGGVGKTTTAVHLAVGLAQQGSRVLLIDLDPQASATSGLNIDPQCFTGTMGSVLLSQKTLNEVIIKTDVDNLYLVPAHTRDENVEQQMVSMRYREDILKKAIECANLEDYDYCLIDCMPSTGLFTINAVRAATQYLVPVETGRYAIEGFTDVKRIVNELNGQDFDNAKHIRILMTKYDARNKLSTGWAMRELENEYKDYILHTKIRKNDTINQSQIANQTVYQYDPSSMGAKDYTALTKELMAELTHD